MVSFSSFFCFFARFENDTKLQKEENERKLNTIKKLMEDEVRGGFVNEF